MRIRAIAMVFGMLGTVLLSGTVSAAEESPRIRADLEGRPIKAGEIGSYYCHDFAFPEVHCFSTASELEAASTYGDGLIASAVGHGDYVTIFADQGFVGPYMHVSQNYDTLFWIGWNDRISSFKARNSARGTFWSDWNGEGIGTVFCCNQTVFALIAAVDNTFTSVYRG